MQRLAVPAELMATARRMVDEAEQQAARAASSSGPTRRLEERTSESTTGEARGFLMALRALDPGNEELPKLWIRVLHCAVIMQVGPEQAEATRSHVQ